MEATVLQAGGTSHRMQCIGKEEEEERWAGTHQAVTNRGKGGRLVAVGMPLGLQVQGVKVHGAMVVVGMMNSGLVNSLHGGDKVVS